MDERSAIAGTVDIAPGKRAGNRRLPQRAREGESITRTGATKNRQNGDSVSRTSPALCNGRRCAERTRGSDQVRRSRGRSHHTRLRDGGDEELASPRERSDENQKIKSVLLRDSRRHGDIRRRRGVTCNSGRLRGFQRRRREAGGCGRCSVARERRGRHDATRAERSVRDRRSGLCGHRVRGCVYGLRRARMSRHRLGSLRSARPQRGCQFGR